MLDLVLDEGQYRRMLRRRRTALVAVVAGVAALSGLLTALGTGCGGGTMSPMDGASGAAGGAAGSSGGASAGNSGAGGSGGGSGGGPAGQGGQVDGGGADLRSERPIVNPTITMLTPSSLPRNNGTFTLLVDGRDFPPDAEITFETNVWRATVVSATQLSAQIPGAALGGMPRDVAVQVSMPTAPYVESNLLYFTITAPQ